MIRYIAIAAAAAILLAAPARAEDIHVSIAGKSVEQIKKEVSKAAGTLCDKATMGDTFPLGAYSACVAEAVRSAMAQLPADQAVKLAQK